MEVKDWLIGDRFYYAGRVLTRPSENLYQYIYCNEKLKTVDAEVVLWISASDSMCNSIGYRINPGRVMNSYIDFWNAFVTAATSVNVSKNIPLNLDRLPLDSSSVVTVENAIENMLQPFYAVMNSYAKDSERYNFSNSDIPIFRVAEMSVVLTDKTPLDWFTLPDGARLKSNIAKLVRAEARDNLDMCTVLENAIQLKQVRAAILKSYFKGTNIQEWMDSAKAFFDSRAFYKMYIPVMRKFFKNEAFFSESYINYQ